LFMKIKPGSRLTRWTTRKVYHLHNILFVHGTSDKFGDSVYHGLPFLQCIRSRYIIE